jgi:8-oxo-dGTP diphosphatase
MGPRRVRGVPRHCVRCGGLLAAPPPTSCSGCGFAVFVDAKPGAGAVIIDGDRFLALRRARDPGMGAWGVPGGFCDGEHPAEAAVREAAEETGLDIELGELVGVYTDSYEFQGEVFPTLHVYYLATLEPGSVLRPDPSEIADVGWFPLADPPPLAFGHLEATIRDAAALAAKLRISGGRRRPGP